MLLRFQFADSGDCFNLTVVDAVRPMQRFIRALFASRLPPGVAYLFAGPLLVVEQLKQQLAIIHEAQCARGVPRWMRAGISVYVRCPR